MFGSMLLFFGGGADSAYTFQEAVVEAVKADAALIALIDDRIYPNVIPETETLTAISVQITEAYGEDLDGSDGTTDATVTFKVRSEDYAECRRVARRLATLFDLVRTTLSAVQILSASPLDRDDEFDFAEDGSDDGIHRDTVRIKFLYVYP